MDSLPFRVPRKLHDAEEESSDSLYVRECIDFSAMQPREVTETLKGLTMDWAAKEVLCIEEQSIFDCTYSAIKHFSALEPQAKSLLVDGLTSNVSFLVPSINSLIGKASRVSRGGEGEWEGEEGEAMVLSSLMASHRNSLTIYVFFIYWLIEAAEVEAAKESSEAGGKKEAKGRKKHVACWDWEKERVQLLRPIAAVLETDLVYLYRGEQPEEGLINLMINVSFFLLQSPLVLREREVKECLFTIVASCATKYGFLEASVSGMVHLMSSKEHTATHMADLLLWAEEKFPGCPLAPAVLREIGRTPMGELARANGPAKSIAAFLVAVSEKLPLKAAHQMAVLLSFLSADSAPIRSAVIALVGNLLVRVYRDRPADVDERGYGAWLKAKEGLLGLLLERVRDKGSYVRSKVLMTWSQLCVEKTIPIGHWTEVCRLAIGRLQDKTPTVRKSALHLLTTQLQWNPFGQDIYPPDIESTLREIEAKHLEVLQPAQKEDGVEKEGEGRVGRVGEGEGEGEGEVEESEGTQYDPSQPLTLPPPAPPSGKEWSLSVAQTLYASLQTGLEYSCMLQGALGVMEELLGSKSATDVEQAITFLILAKQMKIIGAEKSLKKMLPLIFSDVETIRKCMEGAMVSLYLSDSPDRVARGLVQLAQGASLGDLAAMEKLVQIFVEKGDLSDSVVCSLWSLFTYSAPKVTPAHSRGALYVLTMAARAQPAILSAYVRPILDLGLGFKAREDPLLARYACVALQRVAEEVRAGMGREHRVFQSLQEILTDSPLPDHGWYSAAEQAVKAVYALHPQPEKFCAEVLRKAGRGLFQKGGGGGEGEGGWGRRRGIRSGGWRWGKWRVRCRGAATRGGSNLRGPLEAFPVPGRPGGSGASCVRGEGGGKAEE